jgi:glycosyltransferase involved in cell wall biosynthesis
LEIRAEAVSEAEDAEHRKANRIVVASSFTKETLIENGVPAEKVVLNPYGVDLRRFSVNHLVRKNPRFRFVFAGLVCARKGIPLLLQAWTKLRPKDAELWIAGQLTPTAAAKRIDYEQVKFLGKIPNAQLAAIMSESDVFIFPSYFEGFALVLLEAMACCLPAITTMATAGPDIVTQDHDGWIIEPGNLDALISSMRFCLENRDRVTSMGVTPAKQRNSSVGTRTATGGLAFCKMFVDK